MASKGLINENELIDAVQSHTILYKKDHPDYANSFHRQAAWREVCVQCVDSWADLPAKEQDKQEEFVRSRWKNMRDRYNRVLKEDESASWSGEPKPKRRAGDYCHRLAFLNSSLENRVTSGTVVKEEEVGHPVSPAANPAGPASAAQPAASTSTLRPRKATTKKRHNLPYNQALLDEMIKLTRQIMEDQTRMRSQLLDDKGVWAFCASLVHDLKQFPKEAMTDVKLELMKKVNQLREIYMPAASQAYSPPPTHQPQYPSNPLYYHPQQFHSTTHPDQINPSHENSSPSAQPDSTYLYDNSSS